MKSEMRKRVWLIALCLFAGIVSFRHVWLWLPSHRYHDMINNTTLVGALQKDTPQEFISVARSFRYDYQIFKNSKLMESSASMLPTVHLLQPPARAPGVLKSGLQEQLLASRPYEFGRGLHRYIFFSSTAGQYTYVVYGKVF